MAPKITRDTPIGELIMNYPSAVEVLFAHGFHCIGCGLSAYETLEQGAAAHGFDDEAIGQIIREIEEAAKKAEETCPARKCETEAVKNAEKTGLAGKREGEEKEAKAGKKRGITEVKAASPQKASSRPRKKKEGRSKSG